MKRVYRVRSTHVSNGKEYTRTRHFFTKFNAVRSYNWLIAQKDGKKSIGHWGKPIKVEFSESEPLVFMDDEAGLFKQTS